MTRRNHLLIAGGVAVALLTLCAFYYAFDPSLTAWSPRCMVHTLTGLECPGCGSQRMLHALLHGDIASAWRYNPFLLCMLPVIAFFAFSALTRKRYPTLYMRLHSFTVMISLAAAITVWTVARNIWL